MNKNDIFASYKDQLRKLRKIPEWSQMNFNRTQQNIMRILLSTNYVEDLPVNVGLSEIESFMKDLKTKIKKVRKLFERDNGREM